MPETNAAAGGRKLEDFRQLIATTPIQAKDGKIVNVTISGGVAGFPQDGLHDEDLLAVADARLFEAKGSGRNRIVEGSVQACAQ